jgi:FkbM family methyltransferase
MQSSFVRELFYIWGMGNENIVINGIHCLPGDSDITKHIARTGTLKWDVPFKEVIKIVGPGANRKMIDVGAYIGDSTKWFIDSGFECHAFEPQLDAFECLLKNVHCKAYNIPLGSGQMVSTSKQVVGNLGGRSLDLNGEISAVKLDDLFDSVDVIKIDAEGFEPFILEGAKNLLSKKPFVIVEINVPALAKFNFGPEDIFKYFDGYERKEVYRWNDEQYDIVFVPPVDMRIAISAYNRPEYTNRCLSAIFAMKGFDDPSLIDVFVDMLPDGTFNEEISKVLSSYGIKNIHWASKKQGCNGAVKLALEMAWSNNPDFVLMIEDDIIVSVDAWQYATWAARIFKNNPVVRTVGLWNHQDGWQIGKPYDNRESTKVMSQSLFNCWGWGTWRKEWDEMVTIWTQDRNDFHDTSWDIVLLSTLNGRKEVVPSIARAYNCGEHGGTHRGRAWPGITSSGLIDPDSTIEYWMEEDEKHDGEPVYVVLGRFGDIYMVCRQLKQPSIICCMSAFSQIVYDLFPQHKVFELGNDFAGNLARAQTMCTHKYPSKKIIVCQQDGQDQKLVIPFRSFQAFQEYYAQL